MGFAACDLGSLHFMEIVLAFSLLTSSNRILWSPRNVYFNISPLLFVNTYHMRYLINHGCFDLKLLLVERHLATTCKTCIITCSVCHLQLEIKSDLTNCLRCVIVWLEQRTEWQSKAFNPSFLNLYKQVSAYEWR